MRVLADQANAIVNPDKAVMSTGCENHLVMTVPAPCVRYLPFTFGYRCALENVPLWLRGVLECSLGRSMSLYKVCD